MFKNIATVFLWAVALELAVKIRRDMLAIEEEKEELRIENQALQMECDALRYHLAEKTLPEHVKLRIAEIKGRGWQN